MDALTEGPIDSLAGPAEPRPSKAQARTAWRRGAVAPGARELPVETAVALVHDGSTTAVLMATPTDLEDLALGFALTEGLVTSAPEVERLEVVHGPLGAEARAWLAPDPARDLAGRRRRLAGPTGCGLCGVESLEEAVHPPRPVDAGLRLTPAQVLDAMRALEAAQTLGPATRAVHAAAFWTPAEGIVALREDVGRHNALDKLAGALARAGRDASAGAVLLTSRVSVEMVQKAAAIGAPVLIAVSAPTTLAVETAQACGMTLVAVARADGFEVFTGLERIAFNLPPLRSGGGGGPRVRPEAGSRMNSADGGGSHTPNVEPGPAPSTTFGGPPPPRPGGARDLRRWHPSTTFGGPPPPRLRSGGGR